MISIINAIKSLFVGDKEVQSVSIGDTQVYPDPSIEPVYETIKLVKFAAAQYSSGNKLNAAGSNYAELIGTADVYTENVTEGGRTWEGEETVTLIPTATNVNWMSISGTKLIADTRADAAGDERSALVDWVLPDGYSLNEEYMTSPQRVQEANTIASTSAGAITDFRLNGQNTIISIDDTAQTLYISSIAGYRNVSYTSGYTTTISIPNTGYVYTISGGDGWTALNYNGSIAQSISVTANNSGSSREAVVIVKDGTYPSAQASIRIKQAVPWVLSVSSPVYVACDATSFSFNVTSTNNGVAAPITSSMVSIVTNNSNLSLTGIEAVSGSTGVYKISFSCSVNTDTSNTKTSQVRITRSDHTEAPRTVSIIQAADNSALDGLNVVDIADNNTHWVLATYTSGRTQIGSYNYGITGVLIACDSPITSNKTIRFNTLAVQRIKNMGSQPVNDVYNVPQYTTQVVESGSTVSTGNKTYYGAWLTLAVTWGSGGCGSGRRSVPRLRRCSGRRSGRRSSWLP